MSFMYGGMSVPLMPAHCFSDAGEESTSSETTRIFLDWANKQGIHIQPVSGRLNLATGMYKGNPCAFLYQYQETVNAKTGDNQYRFQLKTAKEWGNESGYEEDRIYIVAMRRKEGKVEWACCPLGHFPSKGDTPTVTFSSIHQKCDPAERSPKN